MPMLVNPVVERGTIAAQDQPTIGLDDGLLLRPWRLDDAGAVRAAFSDVAIQRWHRRRLDTVEEARAWIMATRVGWQAETAATWAVAERQRDEVLGRVCLTFTDLENGAAQISYWTVPAARGIGVATRAVVGSSEWAQRDTGFHRLELRHSVKNDASCRVAVKAGYLAEGVLRAAMLHLDGWHDMHVHGSLTEDRMARSLRSRPQPGTRDCSRR